MIKFFAKKQVILTFFAFLISTMAWAEITGSGTVLDPYVLNNNKDWITITEDEATYWGSNVYIKLGADITVVDAVIGYKKLDDIHSFKGHFDGDWHTLTFDLGSGNTPYNLDYAAPFSYVDGAKISNLTVDGMITTRAQYAGTIVGYVSNTSSSTELTSCTSNAYITCAREGSAYHGGMVGRVANGEIRFKWCIFSGSIIGAQTTDCAGFVGYVNGKGDDGKGSVTYQYCTMAYGNITLASDFATFNNLGGGVDASFDGNTYYTRHYESDGQGIQAPTREPDDQIAKKYTYVDSKGKTTTYYVPEAEIDLDPAVIYGGVLKPDVTYYGKKLTDGTHYNLDIKGNVVIVEGIEANGYAGKASISGITLIDITSWNSLKTFLNGSYNSSRRVVALDRDLTAANNETALVASGSGAITLNLNGHQLDRNLYDQEVGVDKGYVMSVEASATMIINGPGVITGGNTKGIQGNNSSRGDGGGIYVDSGGTLTLNSVTITRNKAVRSKLGTDATYFGTGTGVYTKGNVIINDCEIINNHGDGGGGGINTQGGTLEVNRTLISNNVAQSKGGGVRTRYSSRVVFNNCCIRNNTLKDLAIVTVDMANGGGFFFESSATLNNCSILENNVAWRGGGICVHSGTITANNCVIKNNSALGDQNSGDTGGGGAYITDGSLILNNTEITENTSYTVGGVFVKSGKTLKVKGKTIINNNIGDAVKPNVYLESEAGVITIDGTLDKDALIGVSRKGEKESNVTSGLGGQHDGSNFRSDNYKLYWFSLNDGELKINKTYYWRNVSWKSTWDDEVYFVKTGNATNGYKYYIDAPVIIDRSVILGEKDNIYFENSSGTSSTRAAIFIDRTSSDDSKKGQLLYYGNTVKVSLLTNIGKAEAVDKGWYTIASPVGEIKLLGENAGVNLVTAVSAPYNFDLLRYNEEESLWESYTDPDHVNDFKTLKVGQGYLYRNSKGLTLEYSGMTRKTASYDLTYSKTAHSGLEGWNLIGNPYTHIIYKGGRDCAIVNGGLLADGFYRLTNSGAWGAALDDGTAIKPGEGILVKAEQAGELTITNTNAAPPAKKSNNEYLKFTVANSNYDDEAYAVFDEGYGLPKISHRNADIPMVYINKDAENYAIAMMNDDVKSFSLNFKAMKTGQYTLSCEKDGDFSYLHVIDKLAGRDIDMLLDEKYTFIGSPRDADSRFIVRLSYNGGADESGKFAYQNGDDIIVCGEGELQVYDVLGRFVTSKRINGVETINLNATGVYILKLIGEDIRTQKMVVR